MIGNFTPAESRPAWMTSYTWAWLQSVPPNESEKRDGKRVNAGALETSDKPGAKARSAQLNRTTNANNQISETVTAEKPEVAQMTLRIGQVSP